MAEKSYDIIVLGTGGGGKIIAPAARSGLSVAVVEESALGGTCLNRGCIPSKMLIHPADVAMDIRQADKFGIRVGPVHGVNFSELITRISNTVDGDSQKIANGYGKNPHIHYFRGHGKFIAEKTISINGEQITAEKIFIAVGAKPRVPFIPGLAGTPFMTSTEALRNRRLPRKMIVLGGGYIAVELGHAFGALGCETHFLVRSKLVRHEDFQVVEEFHKVFSRQYHVHLGCAVTRVHFADNLFTVTYQHQDGVELTMTADALLVATGVVPNTDDLGLENTGIKKNDDGFIKVDEYLQTDVQGVYAFGDCIGRYLFRHSVNFEGDYLYSTVFSGNPPAPIKYPPMPHAIFTHPQIAAVGKTEDELMAAGTDYVVGLNYYKDSAMGMALLSDHGFVKILVERKSRKILGAHIIGPEASDMIHLLIAFMTMDATLEDLLSMVYIHPALPEIVRNAARKAKSALDT